MWPNLDATRHEVYQWAPYLAPDVKLERAWLRPLNSEDFGDLGLVRDWLGEGPAATAARERLGDDLARSYGDGDVDDRASDFGLQRALRLMPPPKPAGDGAPRSAHSAGPGAFSAPTPLSWRAFHADRVRHAFYSPALFDVQLFSEFKELVGKSATVFASALGVKAKPPLVQFSRVRDAVMCADEELRSRIAGLEVDITSKEILGEVLEELGIEAEKANIEDLQEIMTFAVSVANDGEDAPRAPMTEEELESWLARSDEEDSDTELCKAWQKYRAPLDSEVLGEHVQTRLDEALAAERAEDEAFEGSASEELDVALDIVELLVQLGITPTAADKHALLAAAYALGAQEQAARTLHIFAAIKVQAPPTRVGARGGKLVDAMALGGWDRGSAKDFLDGRRPLPARDSKTELGQLASKYLDPLFGASEGDPKLRDAYFNELRRHGNSRDDGEGPSLQTDSQVEAESVESFPSVKEILDRAAEKKIVAEALLVSVSMSEKTPPSKWLRLLGLQVPPTAKKAAGVLEFVVQTLSEARDVRTRAERSFEAVSIA